MAFTSSFDQVICAFDMDTGKEFFKTYNQNKTHFTDVHWNSLTQVNFFSKKIKKFKIFQFFWKTKKLILDQELITSDHEGNIYFIKVKGEEENFEQKLFEEKIVCFEYLPEHEILIAFGFENCRIMKVNKGFQVQKLNGGHVGPVIGLKYLDYKRIHGSKIKAPSK